MVESQGKVSEKSGNFENHIDRQPCNMYYPIHIYALCLKMSSLYLYIKWIGAQWLSGRVLDSRLKGRGFEPHRRHCAAVLEQETFILA